MPLIQVPALIPHHLLVKKQVGFSESCIMSSCVKPKILLEPNPVVLLHSFDRFVLLIRAEIIIFADFYLSCYISNLHLPFFVVVHYIT